MSNYCPGWILCIFSANAAREVLFNSTPINLISKKYSVKIATHYNEVSPDFIQSCTEKILASLIEV